MAMGLAVGRGRRCRVMPNTGVHIDLLDQVTDVEYPYWIPHEYVTNYSSVSSHHGDGSESVYSYGNGRGGGWGDGYLDQWR